MSQGCDNCYLKCHEKLNNEARLSLFDSFWKLGDLIRQRDFISSRVQRFETKDCRVLQSRRKFSQTYTLSYLQNSYKVCKRFFLATLGISEKMMRTTLEKSNRSEMCVPSPDNRGKHPPGIKLNENQIGLMDEHIESFPVVPAHWCRKDTSKKYLESILNKEVMYSLYVTFCNERMVKPVSKTTYKERLIAKNIAFYIPRKDQCWCYEYELKTADEQLIRGEEYQLHIRRKDGQFNKKTTRRSS